MISRLFHYVVVHCKIFKYTFIFKKNVTNFCFYLYKYIYILFMLQFSHLFDTLIKKKNKLTIIIIKMNSDLVKLSHNKFIDPKNKKKLIV